MSDKRKNILDEPGDKRRKEDSDKTESKDQILNQLSTQQLLTQLLAKDKEREDRLRQLEFENRQIKEECEFFKKENVNVLNQNEEYKNEIQRLKCDLDTYGFTSSGVTLSGDVDPYQQEIEDENRKSGVGARCDVIVKQEALDNQEGYQLFVKGISKETLEIDIQREFERFGSVVHTYNTGHGNAFVTMQIKEDAEKAKENINNQITFGQIKVERARKGIRDLPAEMISCIDEKLSFEERKCFREVCLMCPSLRQKYKDEIEESAILNLRLWPHYKVPGDECLKFLKDFDILTSSRINIRLSLPHQKNLSAVENLERKLIEIIDVSHDRISKISVNEFLTADLLVILLKLTGLEQLSISSSLDRDSKILQNLIRNNSKGLKDLYLEDVRFKHFQFNVMPMLTEVFITNCRGDISIQSLISRSRSIEKLNLDNVNIDLISTACHKIKTLRMDGCSGKVSSLINHIGASLTDVSIKNVRFDSNITATLTNLQSLDLFDCNGDISSLLTQGATNISDLGLYRSVINTPVQQPFLHLKHLTIVWCRGEISSVLIKAAPYISTLNMIGIRLEPIFQKQFKNLNHLELTECSGAIASLLKQVAPVISTLSLLYIDLNTPVETPFSRLQGLKLVQCKGEIASLLNQAAGNVCILRMYDIEMDTFVENPFTMLKEVYIRDWDEEYDCSYVWNEIDISASPLLTKAGVLAQFGSKVIRTCDDDLDYYPGDSD